MLFSLVGYRHADDPAGAARRRPHDGTLLAITHDVVGADLDDRRVRRADGDRDPDDVRVAQPRDHAPARPRSTSRRRGGCGRRVSARACSRSSRRWTSWRSSWASTRSSCASATSPTVDPETGTAVQQPRPGRVPAPRALRRFGWGERDPRPGAGGTAGGSWVRHGVPRSIRPACCGRPLGARPSDGTVRGRHRRRRHRHRRPDGAAAGRRGRARVPSTGSRSASVTATSARPDRRRVDGHGLLELGGRQGVPRSCAATGGTRRCRVDTDGRRRGPRGPTPGYAFGAQFVEARVDATPGRCDPRHGRRLRCRPDHQRRDCSLAVASAA